MKKFQPINATLINFSQASMNVFGGFMVTYKMSSGNQPFGVWSAKAEFSRSDDLWKTKYVLLPRGNRFLFLDKFIDHEKVKWAHLDIAGPVWDDKKGGATGFAAATLAEWVCRQGAE